MAIYLVQHGLSLSKDVDPERRLSEEGKGAVERIAQVAQGYNVPVQGIVHSGKKRALQTAEIFERFLSPQDGVSQAAGIAPLDDVGSFSEFLNPGSGLMYVGHLPFMEKLTGLLTCGDENKSVFSFQNGGIICLDKEPDAVNWQIKWALMPNIG